MIFGVLLLNWYKLDLSPDIIKIDILQVPRKEDVLYIVIFGV